MNKIICKYCQGLGNFDLCQKCNGYGYINVYESNRKESKHGFSQKPHGTSARDLTFNQSTQ